MGIQIGIEKSELPIQAEKRSNVVDPDYSPDGGSVATAVVVMVLAAAVLGGCGEYVAKLFN